MNAEVTTNADFAQKRLVYRRRQVTGAALRRLALGRRERGRFDNRR